MSEKLVEAIARAIARTNIEEPPADQWNYWLPETRAALRAMTEGEVFEEMVERACGAYFDGSVGADHVRASMRLALRAALGDDT